MGKVVCFISQDFADFEVTLAFHKIKQIGKKEVVTMGYSLDPVISESGLQYLPHSTINDIKYMKDVEGLLLPGGPLREQSQELTELLIKLDQEQIMLAAICNGPQYLARAGLLKQRTFTTTCSPKNVERLKIEDPFPRDTYVEGRVVRDGHIITAKGRAFVDFSFAVFDYLQIYKPGDKKRDQLYNDIMDRG